ncbi:MAG: glycoside hydrolase/phage tail family protein [Proteobacteria bacterium]|nr:glycoside hydrolase/phage tail family protein [Pseudomonadota bacterium]
MATLALQIAGSALGSTFGGALGGALGSALGGSLGAMIDRGWMGGGRKLTQGPRLNTLSGITASEGAAIPRIYGRVRIGGQVIWATEFEEEQQIERSGGSGGKSMGGGGTTTSRTLTYAYYANVAIGLCEGPVSLLRRIWVDGKELDLATLNLRFYRGDEDQPPDPLIVAKQESAEVPAFRGLAYAVLERFPLAAYGNRLPQFAFEVVRAAPGLPESLRAINIIPGATEFGYAQEEVREDFGYGSSRALNRTQWTHPTDWDASISDLLALAPNLERATLISAWFGDDLRAGHCTLRPKVEKNAKTTLGAQWAAAGLSRATAQAVSTSDGRPSFGGSPSDASIVAALRDLKARGLKTALHPFILMDIPAGNTLPDPYSGAAGQPAFPWRGRITCDPAPGRPGTAEGAAAATSQIQAFIGTAQASDFALTGETIVYTGPDEWSLRRMVLHHAMLAKAAGGVDTFILSSELIGLTHCAGAGGSFPLVAGLIGMLGDLRTLLGPACTLTYAADWTEYGARVRSGGQDVRFPLDPLWADARIGAIGIDFYPPLSDWRAQSGHLDEALAAHGAETGYLAARIGSGEAYDFYYADDEARADQQRLPITDGAYGKPWVFRAKDLSGFWSNPHIERIGGVELGAPTAFVPQSKPIYLTEIGCPAVARGANQPNVFPDPKSSENALPYFSSGARDDLVQRRLIEAYQRRFDPEVAGFDPAHNPVSALYGARMIDPSFIAPWAWDVRPFPAFPHQQSLWADGSNWLRGHWLNGRLEGVPLRELMQMMAADFGVDPLQGSEIEGFLNGYIVDRPMSLRAALEPVARVFSLEPAVRGGDVVLPYPAGVPRMLAQDDLIPTPEGTLIEVSRAQESELPARLSLGFVDDEDGFQARVVASHRGAQRSHREEGLETALVLPSPQARRLAERSLARMIGARERYTFRLPGRFLDIELGDALILPTAQGARPVRVSRIVDGEYRTLEASALWHATEDMLPDIDVLPPEAGVPALPGAAFAKLIELPMPRENSGLLTLAVRAEPWRGPYALVETSNGNPAVLVRAVAPARLGKTNAAFGPGPLWRWDEGSTLDITLAEGALASASGEAVLAGANALALVAPEGEAEIVLFRSAQLVGQGRYRLSGLLRGLGASEEAAARTLGSGTLAIVLDDALVDPGLGAEALGQTRSFALLPAGRELGDAVQVNLTATLAGWALRPLSPVHPRARREAGGVRVTFLRRTRSGGDNWEAYEVPLAESREAYQLEILNGATVVRSLELSQPEYLYPAAAELADFGAPQSTLHLRIRQISEQAGPGTALEADVSVQ